MMQALSGLMPKSAPAAAQDSPTMAAKAGETEPAGALKDAAMAFAHELFDALRSLGAGDGGTGGNTDGHDGAEHRGRAHGHHHHHHGHRGGYGDLAQRLERLAGSVDAPAARRRRATPPACR